MFGRKTIGLEELLWCFRHSKGLFLLGAGASTGIVPFSQSLMAAPAVDFHDGFTSLSVSPTEKDIAAQRSAAAGLTKLLERRRQPGFDEAMARAVLARMPAAYVNFHMVHAIGKARLDQQVKNLRYRNYSVFDSFQPTVLLNYNLDGVATDVCGARHRVVPVHGTVKAHLGSRDTAALVARLRDMDIDFRFDDLLLCVPEPSFGDPGQRDLMRRLAPMWSFEPDFVAVCGYSFASLDPTTGLLFDDHESLRLFVERFKDYTGPVFVLNPNPATMEMLEHRLRSRLVVDVPYNWNVLSTVMVDRVRGSSWASEPLRDAYYRLIDDLDSDGIAIDSKWKPAKKSSFAARGS